MKLFFYVPQPKSLVLRAFLTKRKERKLQYQWYHNFRSYLVEMRGIEPLSESNLERTSPGAVCYLHSLHAAKTNILSVSVAS